MNTDSEYKSHCMMLVNALIYSPDDFSTRDQIYNEFVSLGLSEYVRKCSIVEKDRRLAKQYQIFQEFEGERWSVFKNISGSESTRDYNQWLTIRDVVGMATFLDNRLAAHSQAHSSFVNILKYFMLVASKQNSDEVVNDWRKLESTISTVLQMRQESIDVKDMTAKEIRLENSIQMQQHSIQKLYRQKALALNIAKCMLEEQPIQRIANQETDELITLMNKIACKMEDLSNKNREESQKTIRLEKEKERLIHEKKREQELRIKVESEKKRADDTIEQQKQIIIDNGASSNQIQSEAVVDRKTTAVPALDLTNLRPTNDKAKVEAVSDVPIPQTSTTEPPLQVTAPPPPPPMMSPPPPPPVMGMNIPPAPALSGPDSARCRSGEAKNLPVLPSLTPRGDTKKVFLSSASVPAVKVSNTLWGEIIAEHALSMAKKLDITELEMSFAKKKSSENTPRDNETPPDAKPQVPSFIDDSHAYRVSLILGYLRMSSEEFKNCLLQMDIERIGKQAVHSMKDLAPEASKLQEIISFSQINGVDNMKPVDALFVTIGSIPRLKQRFACWDIMIEFEQRIRGISPSVKTLLEACQALCSSDSFKQFLVVILNVVNFLNSSTTKPTYGFQLGFLQKLEDIKTTDGKGNLLKFVAETCQRDCSHLIPSVSQQLNSLRTASKIEILEIKRDVKELSTGLITVKEELTNHEQEYLKGEDTLFIDAMRAFVNQAESELRECQELIAQFDKEIQIVVEAFHEKEKEVIDRPHEYFSSIVSVVDKLDKYSKQQSSNASSPSKKPRESIFKTVGSEVKDGTIIETVKRRRRR